VLKMVKDTNAPWRNEALLRQKYWEEGKSLSEVADEFSCSIQTVKNWLDKFGLGTRSGPGAEDADYRNEETLKELYIDKQHSTNEIADILDCSKQTVQKYMDSHGIETRPSNHSKPLKLHTSKRGYEYFSGTQNYEHFTVKHHRLIAYAHEIIDSKTLLSGDKEVHHKNGIPWDNRVANLKDLTTAEHAKLHHKERQRDTKGRYS
jgi:DNA-binding CsgD family transcriptional regulator